MTAAALGSGGLPVFGTPYLVAMVENAAFTYLQQELPEGKSTVGTKVEVSHVSPRPSAWRHRHRRGHGYFRKRQDGRLQGHRDRHRRLIGEGTHQRAVITVDRFMDKCQAKLG